MCTTGLISIFELGSNIVTNETLGGVKHIIIESVVTNT